MYDPKDPKIIEKYSSAVSLSDMEVFIYPELIYALTLANCMSPLLWEWKHDSWFKKIKKMNPYRRTQRVKQFIMDNFTFNLDLETWGLTSKEQELSRFSDFFDTSFLSQSNALFGYEGDKYYFDIDIRRHFGLDKYNTNIIPYWKTETLEAMHAFRYKEGYPHGAGECVSLATLYAAALFVIAEIPLDDIYLMATPLHSQNFIDVSDGVITNNRRIVTKTMWFNGTELSAKARRALENERVTLIAHRTGYIHAIYDEATLEKSVYEKFTKRLQSYLKTDISYTIIANFLRQERTLQRCFQIAHKCCGKPRYIEVEKVYAYEHGSKFRIGDSTQNNLLHEIDEDEYYPQPLENRILLNEIEEYFKNNPVAADNHCDVKQLQHHLKHSCFNVEDVVEDLCRFSNISPRLPNAENKKFIESSSIDLENIQSRNDIIEQLDKQRTTNPIADLAFMAYRDMARSPWKPFLKAALERNPVCVEATADLSIDEVYQKLESMNSHSIYDTTRLSQPDEVWNFNRGDGLEKALTLYAIANKRITKESPKFSHSGKAITIEISGKTYSFETQKDVVIPSSDDFLMY